MSVMRASERFPGMFPGAHISVSLDDLPETLLWDDVVQWLHDDNNYGGPFHGQFISGMYVAQGDTPDFLAIAQINIGLKALF